MKTSLELRTRALRPSFIEAKLSTLEIEGWSIASCNEDNNIYNVRKLSIRRGLFSLYSTTCAWQPIADHNERPESYTTIRRFLSELVDMISLPMDRNYWEVTNLSFALPILYYLNVTYNWEDITILWQRIVDACVALG